jgi:hypothetical protein
MDLDICSDCSWRIASQRIQRVHSVSSSRERWRGGKQTTQASTFVQVWFSGFFFGVRTRDLSADSSSTSVSNVPTLAHSSTLVYQATAIVDEALRETTARADILKRSFKVALCDQTATGTHGRRVAYLRAVRNLICFPAFL